jgi:hypothetical protein
MSDHTSTFLEHARSWMAVFAHPGHELRAYHLLERVRPTVFILTDGSGSTSTSRLGESRSLLAHIGAQPAALFGAFTDREAYTALMAADAGPFLPHVNLLADALLTEGVQALVIDAAEGYNPVHDLCHWLGRAAALRARQFGAEVALFELDLISHPDSSGDGLRLTLDDDAFARKLEASVGYAALAGEVEAAFAQYGREAFRVEFARRVIDGPPPPPHWIPYYEQVGEERVRAGRYASVLRYGSHVKPVIDRLLERVQPAPYATDLRTVDQ